MIPLLHCVTTAVTNKTKQQRKTLARFTNFWWGWTPLFTRPSLLGRGSLPLHIFKTKKHNPSPELHSLLKLPATSHPSWTCCHTCFHSSSRTAVQFFYSWYNSLRQLQLSAWWLRVLVTLTGVICCHSRIQQRSIKHSAIFSTAARVDTVFPIVLHSSKEDDPSFRAVLWETTWAMHSLTV